MHTHRQPTAVAGRALISTKKNSSARKPIAFKTTTHKASLRIGEGVTDVPSSQTLLGRQN